MASEGYKMPRSTSIYFTNGDWNEICENAKVTIMRDTNCKEEDSLDNTAYAYLCGCKSPTKIAKASLDIVRFYQWNEKNSSMFGGTPDKERKKICKSIYPRLRRGKDVKCCNISIDRFFTKDDALITLRRLSGRVRLYGYA